MLKVLLSSSNLQHFILPSFPSNASKESLASLRGKWGNHSSSKLGRDVPIRIFGADHLSMEAGSITYLIIIKVWRKKDALEINESEKRQVFKAQTLKSPFCLVRFKFVWFPVFECVIEIVKHVLDFLKLFSNVKTRKNEYFLFKSYLFFSSVVLFL